VTAPTWPRVSAILAESGLGPDFSGIPVDVLAAAQARGVAVHALAEAVVYRYLDESDVTPTTAPYLHAFRAFLSESAFQPVAAEFRVEHIGWKFCGHPDLWGWLLAKRALIDLKTSASLDLDAAARQLAAYRMAMEATRPTEPIEVTAALQLRADATYRFHELDTHGRAEQEFTAAVVVYHAKRRTR